MQGSHPQHGGSGPGDAIIDQMIALSATLRWEAVPEAARRAVRRALLDYLGCLAAGRGVKRLPPWLAVLLAQGGAPEAGVMGGERVPAQMAALANGYLGHVLEFDDTHETARLHAASATVPAILAAAQRRGGVRGAELCEAVLLAIELTSRIGRLAKVNLAESGWIFSALFGHFGAALGAARILSNDEETLRNAIGIAYSLASGNHQSTREGAPTKHVQPGFAAANGVLAALMAQGGLRGVRQPFGGQDGLGRVYLGGRLDTGGFPGASQTFEVEALSFKPFPTCRFTHPALTALLDMLQAQPVAPESIEAIDIEMSLQAWDVVGATLPRRLHPQQTVDAQFSVQWAVSVALVHGRCSLAELAAEVPPTPPVQRLIERCTTAVATHMPNGGVGAARVRVRTPLGMREAYSDRAKGHPDAPLSDAELLEKFVANVTLGGRSKPQAEYLAERVSGIDSAADAAQVLDRLFALEDTP